MQSEGKDPAQGLVGLLLMLGFAILQEGAAVA
jgi:hypothetical protein